MQLDLGQKIRQLRQRDGRTQEALAEAIGVTSQAVSRWEANGGYPDMEMIPSIANYFGISIDELFGYHNERTKKVDALVAQIEEMNSQNNGEDVNIEACIALARTALAEFPGNEKLMLSLASVLYNAGYVSHSEYHLTDEAGYNIYDAERHRTYSEWTEAIALYEKVLKTIENGEFRHRAVCELMQLYVNIGEHSRAMELVETAPDIYGTREFLKAKATDGKERTEAYGEALLKTVRACSELMVSSVIAYEKNMLPDDKVRSLQGAVDIFGVICPDGNFGLHHSYIARIYTLLSLYLWLDGKKDESFTALNSAENHFEQFKACHTKENGFYTAPLVRLVSYESCQTGDILHPYMSLAEDWPWWSVPEDAIVRKEIQADPRWKAWVSKLQK